MRFALNPITTMESDFQTAVESYHAAGITHMEFWVDKLDEHMKQHDLSQVTELLTRTNMTLVAGICVVQIMLRDVTSEPDALAEYKRRLALCRDLRCPVMVFIPENPESPDRGVYTAMQQNLRGACDVAADYDVKLALEFLQGNSLVATLATAKQIVRNVDHSNLGLLIDLSHVWMGRSDLADLEDLTCDELLLVHVDDMERIEPELLTDHHRTFPGLGRGIDRRIVPAIQATGYDGYWSLEVFNHAIWSQPIDQIVSQSVESFDYLRRTYAEAEATGPGDV